ncbi:MAG: DNA (cytosine-5-)-methyltransferase, partial [Nanoarchaeota archaeon]
MRSAWNVEREPTCRKLLAAKFPNAAQYDDVQTVGTHNLAPVDLICGGFPCQDLSVAGHRAGLSGSRSGLYYHLTRITDALKPAFLLWENVPGLHSSDDGRDFARVLMELARIGYSGVWRTFDAQYFGLAQRRRRIFSLFARGDTGAERAAEILSLAEGVRWHPAPRREAQKNTPSAIGRSIALCLNAGRDGYND